MTRSDDDFRDFVVGFADPLARLAYLLSVGATVDRGSEDLTIDALAQVRRQWHEAESTGAPEPLAIEALVNALPSLRHATRPAVGRGRPGPRAARTGARAVRRADVPLDIDDARVRKELRELIWSVWVGLPPRERVPLVFADPSAAARRLVGLDIPASFGSARRREQIAEVAVLDVREGLPVDVVIGITDGELRGLVTETLREHSAAAPIPIDPYPTVVRRAQRASRRVLTTIGVVVAVLAAGAATATALSAPKKSKPLATATTAHALPGAAHAALTEPGIVVDWPTRGTLASDASLLASIETSFVQLHPDATGQVQVLLVTDTTAFRLAYATANSPGGVIGSWFAGPLGSSSLAEGASSYGAALSPDSVLATTVSDSNGHSELVVIGPPTADAAGLADVDTSVAAQRPDLVPLQVASGIAVSDVSQRQLADLLVEVSRGPTTLFHNHVTFTRLAQDDSATTVEHGAAPPGLLSAAMVAADIWRRTGALGGPATREALWGGTDTAGIGLVLVRLKTESLVDGLVVEWNAAPGAAASTPPMVRHEEVSPTAPDVPLAFSYGTGRVGIVVPATIGTTVLVVDGQDEPPVKVDAQGFAAMTIRDQRGLLSEQSMQVDLYDTAGHVQGTVPVADVVP